MQNQVELEQEQLLLNKLTGELIDKMERGERPNFSQYAIRYPELAATLKIRLADYWLEDRQRIREFEEERATPDYVTRLTAKIAEPIEQARVSALVSRIAKQVAAERT